MNFCAQLWLIRLSIRHARLPVSIHTNVPACHIWRILLRKRLAFFWSIKSQSVNGAFTFCYIIRFPIFVVHLEVESQLPSSQLTIESDLRVRFFRFRRLLSAVYSVRVRQLRARKDPHSAEYVLLFTFLHKFVVFVNHCSSSSFFTSHLLFKEPSGSLWLEANKQYRCATLLSPPTPWKTTLSTAAPTE